VNGVDIGGDAELILLAVNLVVGIGLGIALGLIMLAERQKSISTPIDREGA
jgi:hypothetical protein